MAEPKYDVVISVLKNYYDLGLSEAKLFVRLMERQSFILEDVKAILKNLKEKKVDSRAYQLITALKKAELVEEIRKTNPKTFRPLHPRIVFDKIKNDQKDFDDAFGVLEQAYENFIESGKETKSCFDVVTSEGMMINKIKETLLKGYKITKIVSNDSKFLDLIRKSNDGNLSANKEDGKSNYVIFEKNKKDMILFALCSISPLSGKTIKEGIFILDSNFAANMCDMR